VTQSAQPSTTSSSAPTCPQCAGPMRARSGPHGSFWGCRAYPNCRGTRPLDDDAPPALGGSRPEEPSAAGDLVRDLRRAGGHIGAALELLGRHRDEIEKLIEKAAESDVPF
jgi:DNA topoisomerase-3